jgi:hypothetical protein
LEPADIVPVEMLLEWLDESYRAIAPKKVVTQLDFKQKAKPAKRALTEEVVVIGLSVIRMTIDRQLAGHQA